CHARMLPGGFGPQCARRFCSTRWGGGGQGLRPRPRPKGGRDMPGLCDPYRLLPNNSARQSENKMHDDTVARQFGFAGGLVPGVDVMAYMTHPAMARWRGDFLQHGLIRARLHKPVYDGELTTLKARPGNCGPCIQGQKPPQP